MSDNDMWPEIPAVDATEIQDLNQLRGLPRKPIDKERLYKLGKAIARDFDMADVNLCKGCGTMKHLDVRGYCGRCSKSSEQTIDSILETLMSVKYDGFGNDLDIAQAKAQLSAAIDRVLGPDIKDFTSVGNYAVAQRLFEQRTRKARFFNEGGQL